MCVSCFNVRLRCCFIYKHVRLSLTYLLRRRVVTGQFVTPGSRLSNELLVHFFALGGGLLLGQSSPKYEMACYSPRSTILPNFIALCQPMPEISVIENFADKQRDKERKKE